MTMDQWTRRTEIPLGGAAALFLIAYAWPIINPDLNQGIAKVCTLTTLVVWVLFVVDYLVRVGITDDRWHYVLHHIPDLLVIALPLLRPLRLLRLVALLRIMNRSAAGSLRGKVAIYVTGGGLMLVFVAALAVLDEERGQPGSNIENLGDALWWALTTVTTVGYGDQFPVTERGRVVAAGLMICGIALIGLVTATLASYLVEAVTDDREAVSERAQILAEIAALRRDLAALAPGVISAPGPAQPKDVGQ
jgi:voltage-gated potassium channel